VKVALISDLHANVPALTAVLDDIAARSVELVVCLGDIVDLGPEPREIIALLQARNIPCLQGNHDPFDAEPIVPVDVYEWSFRQLPPADLEWLRALPKRLRFQIEGLELLCVHGSPRSYDEQILPNTPDAALEQMVFGESFDVLACGHTHVQLQRRLKNRLIVNSGSVGMPFFEPLVDPTPPRIHPWAEFAVVTLENGIPSAELCRVDYDVDEYFKRVRASSMPDPEGWIAAWSIG
jgi:putative phosphoesterase